MRTTAACRALAAVFAALLVVGCRGRDGGRGAAGAADSGQAIAVAGSAEGGVGGGVDGGATATDAPRAAPGARGSSIALAGDVLFLADEDHRALRIVPVPSDKAAMVKGKNGKLLAHRQVALPGRPANVLVAGDRIFVTIRDPGMWMVFRRDDALGAIELARAAVPADAWGLALTPDEKIALVTSAWTHKLTAVDVGAAKALWTIDLPREPRGIAIRADGATAYVSHLTSSGISRIDGIAGAAPSARTVALPASPLRAKSDAPLDASLGYSLVLSPDGSRLYAPRHALGATGDMAWFGTSSIDVLVTAHDEPLAPKANVPADGPLTSFVEPRFVLYRPSSNHVLVVSEGTGALTAHDVWAIDPALATEISYPLDCGGASGAALSSDETTAYVYCAGTNDLVVVDLSTSNPSRPSRKYRVAEETLPEPAATGRRLFFDANDSKISGGLACAGCHPEGRDDGHVWREVEPRRGDAHVSTSVEPRVFVGGPLVAGVPGQARQTPMLAGRVGASGPFGWHAENPDLESRIAEGIHLHRWLRPSDSPPANAGAALVAFLRQGLVPPPRDARPPNDEEQRGRAIFTSKEAQCSFCHVPDNDFTDRAPHPLRPWSSPGFEQDDAPFRTPSLLFVSGSTPYFHDGSEPSLEALVDHNDDRMGKTKQLSPEDKRALVAFLRTL